MGGGGTHIKKPSRVAGAGTDVVVAKAGKDFSVAARRNGAVWAWGFNTYGQFGDGTTTLSATPVQVPGFSLTNADWLSGDPDGDGLTTYRELQLGTDPLNPDTNGDAVPDGAEVAGGLSPTNLDMDGDGLANPVEIADGTSPFRADTDGDGVGDGQDAFPLDSSRSQGPQPTPGDTTPPTIILVYPRGAILISGS